MPMPTIRDTDEQIAIAGLSASAEIIVDHWGIPHLRASNQQDLFFLQGFNAARDRLWQIDLWRKRGLGLLSRGFGAGFLAQDRASRAFLFRGDMDKEWASYDPGGRAVFDAFVAGINAYVELTEREPKRLTVEFEITGSRPDRWQAEDVVRIRSHALTRNALSEVLRAKLASVYGDKTDLLRKNLEPPIMPGNAGDIDLADVPIEVLDIFKLATATVTFSPERMSASLAEAGAWTKLNDLAEVVADSTWTGSNNWAIAPSRTTTGRAIMAGDPHRNHALPATRYLVHMTAPGLDVIGAGEPAVPGISMGHNGTIAFTQTIFGSDQEDIYVYETEPGHPDRYRFNGEWVAMDIVEERFAVKGAPEQTERLRFTRHGPVLCADPEKRIALALRSVWFEPGSAAYLAGLSSMRAKTFDEFKAAIARFATPSLNHLYADLSGTIAWLPFGATPVRPNWDGLLPIPGDGRFEWDGFLGIDDMPSAINPADGFLATANEYNTPADWDHAQTPIGYEWLEKSRALRIREVLAADNKHSLQASLALQTDVVSWPARRLQALLRAIEPAADDTFAKARVMLLDWDNALHATSAAGALSELWYTKHLKPALFALLVPDARLRALVAPGDVEGALTALENPDARFGAAPAAVRDKLLADTLAAAWADAAARLGPEPEAWQWGQLHHGYFENSVSPLTDAATRRTLDVGPLPKGGSASTIMHAAYRPQDFRIIMGASVRFVLDVGDWDASMCINTPGQSGDSRSPHYRDLSEKWAKGDYVPFLYTQGAVDAAATTRIVLTPAIDQQRPSAAE
jgi:penicillin amidase